MARRRRRNPVSGNMALLIGVGVAALAGGAVLLATATPAAAAPAAKPSAAAWSAQQMTLAAGTSPSIPRFFGTLTVNLPAGASFPTATDPRPATTTNSYAQSASTLTSYTFVITNTPGSIAFNWTDSAGKVQTTQVTVT